MISMINLYEGDYKKHLLLPAALFMVFLFLIFVYPTVPRGIDLKGGTMIIIRGEKEIDSARLASLLNKHFPLSGLAVNSISSPGGFGTVIEYAENKDLAAAKAAIAAAKGAAVSDPARAKQLAGEAMSSLSSYVEIAPSGSEDVNGAIALAENAFIMAGEAFHDRLFSLVKEEFALSDDIKVQIREVGGALGDSFWGTALMVSMSGFILLVLIVFIFFREIVPSISISASAIFDVAGALALMALCRTPLSLSSIASLLMLVGYSVDTDILLATRLLKRKEGTPAQRAADSMRTGLTMTFTTLGALVSMLVLSYFTQMFVIFEIASVLFFGLCADTVATWVMNASVLLWYVELKERRKVL